MRVYERLRLQLGAPVGVDGFQTLASRALALAKSESPRLSAVQVTANGGLRGLSEAGSQTNADEDSEAGIILIAQLLGLFLTFLGEATTLRLIEDLRLQVEVRPEPATAAADTTNLAADGPAMAAAFEDLLREIDRLRRVSESYRNPGGQTSRHGRWARECCGKHSQYRHGFGRFHTHPKQGWRPARRRT